MKVAGFAMKASSASKLSKQVQETAFDLICDGADEVVVTKEMREIVASLKNGGVEPSEVCTTTRLGMAIYKYKTLSGASRAAKYYNDNIEGPEFGKGDSVSWVYVKSVPAGKNKWGTLFPETDIVAFRETEDLEGFTLDTNTIINKAVKAKLKSAYDTLEWDLDAASGAAIPKKYW
jgi:DNA polymerase elongation subunit (family B)